MRHYVLIALLTILIVPGVLGHVDDPSYPILVLVQGYDATTDTYTFTCDIPDNADAVRTWSFRKDGGIIEAQFQTTERVVQKQLLEYSMYHIECGVHIGGEYQALDYHIDRRVSPYNDKPTVYIYDAVGLEFTASCIPHNNPENYQLYWYFNHGNTHIQLSEFTNQQTIRTNAPSVGSWEVACGIWSEGDWVQSSLTVHFFSEDPTYIPNWEGCDPSRGCYKEPHTPNHWVPPPNATNTTPEEPPEDPPTNTCYEKIYDLPVTCPYTITKDEAGGCRTIECSDGNNAIEFMACDKPGSYEPTHYELYRLSTTGTPPEVCLGEACLTYSGFAQANYPYCNGETPPEEPPVEEPPEEPTCTNTVKTMKATCTGGTITTDTYNGCRTITCEEGEQSLSILACNKENQYELYKKSSNTNNIEICLQGTCIQNNGYAAGTYTCEETPPEKPPEEPPTTEALSIAPWYPQGNTYIFICELEGPTRDYYFGDGHKYLNTPRTDVYYTYNNPGTYTVVCENSTGTASIEITVN